MATKQKEENETPKEDVFPGGIPREPYDPTAPRPGANPAPETVDLDKKQRDFDQRSREDTDRALQRAEEDRQAGVEEAQEHQDAKEKAEKHHSKK